MQDLYLIKKKLEEQKMNEYFPHLFEPIKIGKATVKNRIFMPPISTNMADKGYVTDALVEHYSARAKVLQCRQKRYQLDAILLLMGDSS